ncbi:Hypothetical protein POVN_LOCUS362 [uncultured virus]|nr:Hypothetical protein POVN_LOCUS362 [uncultured virus]
MYAAVISLTLVAYGKELLRVVDLGDAALILIENGLNVISLLSIAALCLYRPNVLLQDVLPTIDLLLFMTAFVAQLLSWVLSGIILDRGCMGQIPTQGCLSFTGTPLYTLSLVHVILDLLACLGLAVHVACFFGCGTEHEPA